MINKNDEPPFLAARQLTLVRVVGVEPTRITSQEPKSCASANSAIPAYISGRKNCSYFLLFGTAKGQDEAQICYLCLCSILSVMLPSLLIFLVALIIEPSGWLNILVTRAVHLPAKVSVLSGVILGNAGKLLFCFLSFPIGISSCKFIHLQKPTLRWHHLNPACQPIPPYPHIWAAGETAAIFYCLVPQGTKMKHRYVICAYARFYRLYSHLCWFFWSL